MKLKTCTFLFIIVNVEAIDAIGVIQLFFHKLTLAFI